MALGLGYGLPFSVKRPVQGFSEDVALSVNNALADAAQREEAGNCLAARAIDIMQTVQTQPSLLIVPQLYKAGVLYDQLPTTRTNFIPNNSMAGATGSVLPTTWASGSIPAGFTFSVGASGQATANDGTVVNYVDVSVSGTATASGTFNLFFSAATGAVTATTGQTFTLSAYATCISGDITTPAMVLQVQEVSGSTFQAGTSTNIALASGAALQRVSAVRTFNQSGVTAARGRIGHPIVSGTTYNYTIRIGSPQLERLSVPTPMIATSTGAVTRLNESTDVVGLPPDFTVSRNTGATRVGPNGLIETGNTNLALRSEAFDVSGTWSRNLGGTGLLPVVTANSVISPDGNQTAETVVFDRGAGNTINDRSFLEQSFTIPTTGTYTFSVYAKASAAGDVGKQIFIRLGGSGGLIAITLTANWTRYSQVEASVASGSQVVQIGNRGTFTADNSVSVDLWGAQVESGSIPTSYIPTTTVARTRFAGVTVDGTIAANIPRIDWLGQSCPGLLVEASGQNLALQSAGFQVSGTWSPTDISVTTGSTSAFTAPDGTTNADLFTSTASAVSFLAQTITIASGAATFSVFAKAGNHGIFRIGNVSSATRAAWFDLNAGAVIGTVNGGTASIQNYGSGWYRCIFTASSVVSGGSTFIIAISDAANGTASVSGATMYAWGAQLEVGSIATTYIPTTTGTGSRAADVISASGALVSGLIGQTEGTIYAEVDYRNFSTANQTIVQLFLDASNRFGIAAFRSGANNGFQGYVVIAGNVPVNITYTIPSAGIYKIAFGYKLDDYVLYINGTQIGTDTSGGVVAANTIHLGHGSSANFLNDRIRAAALYTTRLSNDDLIRLTLPSTYVTYNDMALGLAYTIK